MGIVSSMPPMLSLVRSAQSGNRIMTAAWQVVFTENTAVSLIPYLFAGAMVDLSSMLAGDTIEIRIRRVLFSGGAWVNEDVMSYSDAQPVNHPSVSIGPFLNVFGVEVSMRQTAGVLATIPVEAYYAKRLGLG